MQFEWVPAFRSRRPRSAASSATAEASAGAGCFVAGVVLVEELDRDGALEQPVAGAVDARHAARADELLELVAIRDQLADHVRR